MTLNETLKNIVGAEKAAEIMKIANAAQLKYLASDKGKEARKRANLKYRTNAIATDPQVVRDHLIKFKEEKKCEYEIVTNLWRHYCDDYECGNKIKLTRKQYQTLLDQTDIQKQNPHWRDGQKYYADGYNLSS